jgi:DNA modification methylase
MKFELHHGDCLDVLKTLADCSVDAIVTDPPYGLGKEPDPVKVMAAWVSQGYFEVEGSGFMGKKWDAFVPQPIIWKEVFRVLKPGGHLLAFAGTRTQDWMAMSLRFAGFEIRDMIAWVYGSGFPKSLDVSKAIDKAAGAEREVVNTRIVKDIRRNVEADLKQGKTDRCGKFAPGSPSLRMEYSLTAPATEAAKQWEGWGTALKPALEPITLARKPPIGTIAANVLEHGTGGLNIDGCRIATENGEPAWHYPKGPGGNVGQEIFSGLNSIRTEYTAPASGRFPANFIHDNSEEVLALFPEVAGVVGARREGGDKSIFSGGGHSQAEKQRIVGGVKDTGSAARFFYCAKASRDDRDEGCGELEERTKRILGSGIISSDHPETASGGGDRLARNPHPTVKPTDLMRYLCRLITPPKGIVLDPFMGSGSTGKAAMAEGFRFIGIEREAEYIEIARARISAEAEKPRQLSLF